MHEHLSALRMREDELEAQCIDFREKTRNQISAIDDRIDAVNREIRDEKRKAIVDGGILRPLIWSFIEIDGKGAIVLECSDVSSFSKEHYNLLPSNGCYFALSEDGCVKLLSKRLYHVAHIELLRLKIEVGDNPEEIFTQISRLGLIIDRDGLGRAMNQAVRRGELLSRLSRNYGRNATDTSTPTE